MLRSVELFAGAGGLAAGISNAGFAHDAVVERDRWACDTIRENQRRSNSLLSDWNLYEMDVRDFDYSKIDEDLDLLAGGPPCQPFSIGGKHAGYNDERDMFSEMARAMRELRPKAVLIENVKGLLRQSFVKYFEYITLQLSYPEVIRLQDEDWTRHLARLEQCHTHGRYEGLSYRVVFQLLNAADFGVPQKRERVFLVAFRQDMNIAWAFPEGTHSYDALLYDKWVTGEYWDRHKLSEKARPCVPSNLYKRVDQISNSLFPPDKQPWVTVRDAISDLLDPELNASDPAIENHRFQPGARSYKGHTGSPFDEPAKTLKAGVHGVPGGENMLAKSDGSVRYFTVRESARIQTFPDSFVFHGSWTETMRQLGNAVPVLLGNRLATDIALSLNNR